MTSEPPKTSLSAGTDPERAERIATDEACGALIRNTRETGGGIMQVVVYDKNRNPLSAVIVVVDPEQAADVLAAIKDIE